MNMKLGYVNRERLKAMCPECGKMNLPYEINVGDFDEVFCRYQCNGEIKEEGCKVNCGVHYGADGKTSTWVD